MLFLGRFWRCSMARSNTIMMWFIILTTFDKFRPSLIFAVLLPRRAVDSIWQGTEYANMRDMWCQICHFLLCFWTALSAYKKIGVSNFAKFRILIEKINVEGSLTSSHLGVRRDSAKSTDEINFRCRTISGCFYSLWIGIFFIRLLTN